MTRSHKTIPSYPSNGYWNSSSKMQLEKHLSHRAAKRKTKEYLGDSSQHIYASMPGIKKVDIGEKYLPMESVVDLRDSLSYLECYEEERNEGLRNIEEMIKNEMMEEWKLAKPIHVVKKTIKKLEREGKFTIFDDEQVKIPQDCKKRISVWENKAQSMIHEAKKYESTGSLSSFRSYRQFMHK